MHKNIQNVVFLSTAGDFYILLSILHYKNDVFLLKIHKFDMVKSQKILAFGE